jgi:hypothetical protein
VIQLGPPPVVPDVPGGTEQRLYDELAALAAEGAVSEAAVVERVRSAYAELERNARAASGGDPGAVLDGDEILAGNDWVSTVNGVIGVAIGRDTSCVLARISPHEVGVWRPPRISLEPGEVGCSAAWAARGGQ